MRIGSICYATTQGLGYLAKDFFDHGVISEVMIFAHPGGRPTMRSWYPDSSPVLRVRPFAGPHVDQFLSKIDACVFFETPFDWSFLGRCAERGIRTVLVPMHEWFPEHPSGEFDKIICPSLLDLDEFKRLYPLKPVTFLPVPAPVAVEWRLRERAEHFVHNAGHIGSRNHKGTEELLKALPMVRSNARFTIRCQDEKGLRRLIATSPAVAVDRRVTFVFGEVTRGELFAAGDCYVAPEKYNGLSLPLQEAFAAGMPVFTTKRFPATTWLPNETMIEAESFIRCRAAPGHLEIDEAVVAPEAIAAKIDEWFGRDISRLSLAGRDWAAEFSWCNLRDRWIEEVCS